MAGELASGVLEPEITTGRSRAETAAETAGELASGRVSVSFCMIRNRKEREVNFQL